MSLPCPSPRSTARPRSSTRRRRRGGRSRHATTPPSCWASAPDDLRTQLKSGTALDEIASSKGVSSSDLVSALKSDLQADEPADAPQLSDDQLTQPYSAASASTEGGVVVDQYA
jgi:hypothetical protein